MMPAEKFCKKCGAKMVEKHNSLINLYLISTATYTLPEPIVTKDQNGRNQEVYEVYWECPNCKWIC
jgi:hypothetical protein